MTPSERESLSSMSGRDCMPGKGRLLLALCWLLAFAASAEASGRGHVSGFGSFAYSHDDAADAAMLRDSTQPVTSGTDSSLRSDSILGLQAGYRFSPALEVVSQIVWRDRVDSHGRSLIDWAYLAWRPAESVDLRLGRVGLDAFMLSDYRSVGYAQPWVRPPREFYGRIPMHSIDGFDAAWRFDAAGMRWTAKMQVGRADSELPTDDDKHFTLKVRRFHDLTLQAERNDWQFRLGYAAFRLDSEPDIGPLKAALGTVAAGPYGAISEEAAALNADLRLKGTRVRYLSLGAAYDDGRWQIQGEMARITADSKFVSKGIGAYLSVGYRLGRITPYAVIAGFRPERSGREAINDWSGLGAGAQATQNGAVAALNSFRIDQKTLSLGMRWDFSDRAAVKTQWDRSFVDARGYGLWQIDNRLNGARKSRIDVLSVSLDFTF